MLVPDRRRHSFVKNLYSPTPDFELEGLAMRVPSPPHREEKRQSIHVRLVETGSNATHTEGKQNAETGQLMAVSYGQKNNSGFAR